MPREKIWAGVRAAGGAEKIDFATRGEKRSYRTSQAAQNVAEARERLLSKTFDAPCFRCGAARGCAHRSLGDLA